MWARSSAKMTSERTLLASTHGPTRVDKFVQNGRSQICNNVDTSWARNQTGHVGEKFAASGGQNPSKIRLCPLMRCPLMALTPCSMWKLVECLLTQNQLGYCLILSGLVSMQSTIVPYYLPLFNIVSYDIV